MKDFLHAYWRMEYVQTPRGEEKGNPFVELPKHKEDKEVYIVYRGEHAYIVMNKYPYNAGHLLVVPYKEVADLADLDEAERIDFMNTLLKAQEILKKAMDPHGFNIGFNLGCAAGAGIPTHLHCHVVPRWMGDTNFMPVIGQTRVLPEALSALWERLRNVADTL